jgi:hypothetical protein
MSHTENSLTRRELLKAAGKATAVVVASPIPDETYSVITTSPSDTGPELE